MSDTGAVEVRVRHYMDAKAKYLTHERMDRLDTVIRHLSSWGIEADEGGDTEQGAVLTGRFVVDETGAYFEITVGHG